MKVIDKYKQRLKIIAEDGETLELSYTNRTDGGYHNVLRMEFDGDSANVCLELSNRDSKQIRDLLIELYSI